MAKVGRNQDFGDRRAAHPRVGQLVTDQLFQLFPEAFGDAFVPMGVHVFRIQYVRENSGVFAARVRGVGPQPLRVYSEFAQIDATGKVTAPAEPREILSPAIARNAFSSFQVVVDVPQGTPYQLYVAQNPENAVEVTLYRENGDKLERVEQPVSGDSTQVFWMDLWTARDAPVAADQGRAAAAREQ